MDVVILHCHFEPGGVTQVVQNHVRALRESGLANRIVLVSGDRTSGLSKQTIDDTEQFCVVGFDYDDRLQLKANAQERGFSMASEIDALLTELGLQPDSTILHWHNHSLGKNASAPAAISALRNSGWCLLLQIHDFAEDNRPGNYAHLISESGLATKEDLDNFLYPVASQIHYCALTSADANVVTQLGVPAGRTHCLPNSVTLPVSKDIDPAEALEKVRRLIGLPNDARWCLYPVRGIRRKNVGEFLLLSRWMPDEMFSGITLCPTTPIEKRSYERWKHLATEVATRAVFDAAHYEGLAYIENLLAASFVVSTSVAEGFGMAFLEPWLAERRVVARRLPTVTDDFEATGLDLSQFYDRIPIPGTADWIKVCRDETINAMNEPWRDVPEEFRPALKSQDRDGDAIDFAFLTPSRQEEVLHRIASDDGFENEVKERSRTLIGALVSDSPQQQLVTSNAAIVRDAYAVSRTSELLKEIYDSVLAADATTKVETAGYAIDLVSKVRPFYPCRVLPS